MAYSKQTWTNGDSSTPLSGQRLTHIEDGIGAAHDAVASHSHAATDVTSGTFAVARIPNVAQSKVTNLVDDLAEIGTRLGQIEARLGALESPAEG